MANIQKSISEIIHEVEEPMIYTVRENYTKEEIIDAIRDMAREQDFDVDEYVESGWFERDMIQDMLEGYSYAPSIVDIRFMVETIELYIDTWRNQDNE